MTLHDEELVTRALVYELLSLGFLYPEGARVAQLTEAAGFVAQRTEIVGMGETARAARILAAR